MTQPNIDFETQLFILEAQLEIEEFNKSENERLSKNPEWWNIAIGNQQASKEQYEKACEIRRQFLDFCRPNTGKSFDELVNLFTVAKMQNKI